MGTQARVYMFVRWSVRNMLGRWWPGPQSGFSLNWGRLSRRKFAGIMTQFHSNRNLLLGHLPKPGYSSPSSPLPTR